MTDTSFQEELDMRILSEEALEVLAMRPCSCKRPADHSSAGAVSCVVGYRCLAHRAIDELEQRERREARHG